MPAKLAICIIISSALLFSFFILPCPLSQGLGQVIRVAVVTDAAQIQLAIRSPFKVYVLSTNELLYESSGLWNAQLTPSQNGIKIDKIDFRTYGLRIQPQKDSAIYLDERRFRGAVDIICQPDNKLIAINRLDVEDYLQGVLAHEVAAWWPMEALKAQAIAARTFALYQAKVNAKKDYDLLATAYSQVYGGVRSEKARTSKAVRLTKDKALTYKDKLFPAFYHATCAGHTEEAGKLWKIDLEPLRGRQCQFCRRSPHFHWKAKVTLTKIKQALEGLGVKAGLIKAIAVKDRDVSGRVTELKIESSSGVLQINANALRLNLGPNLIKSANFTIKVKKGTAYFDGYGWGHGVGMCQWGSFFMARERFNAEQILDYYYPASKIKKIDEISDAQGQYPNF